MTTVDIKRLHKLFRVVTFASPSNDNEIAALYKYLGKNVSSEFVDFIKTFAEVEILIKEESYIRIWGAKGCIEMNESYHIQNYIPGSIAFGDDEGGQVLLFANGKDGFGIYKVGFGNLDLNDAKYIASTLEALFYDGEGIDDLL